ncbi:CinA family protein [Candidatus Nitrosacidococcus sp. I8]|uniref:CinA family protein n=1 Tax=Candidatus Nitrosacidococcus sp. I8 TaxID=2942908 RepID=UPI002226409E|nr:CinA family protein [Candidatus Nitrosacidococcus sp. I8]CAH9018806.1 Nicotinamide-nucleotide amidohydrolase PncC [Candidatus Nitrosacidococcus sp. I8]
MRLETLAWYLGETLKKTQQTVVTAESCTGGGVAQAITAIAGSSQWFEQGFIVYSNRAKQELLKVSSETLSRFGAVSEQTVKEMAKGALDFSHADISIATSGIAGPTGGSLKKPVGTVWFAWGLKSGKIWAAKKYFFGNRTSIQEQAVQTALQRLLIIL